MSEAVDARLVRLFRGCETRQTCLAPTEDRDRRALRRRAAKPDSGIASPQEGLYVRTAHWERLSPEQRELHVMRGIQELRPHVVFCAQSAAVAWGLPVSWSRLGTPQEAHWRESGRHSRADMGFHQIGNDMPVRTSGVWVTSFWRTVFDCLVRLPFPEALAVADVALARYARRRADMMWLLSRRFAHHPGIRRARAICAWAEPLAESGGESIARAQMICLGYALPHLQLTLPDPLDQGHTFRIDFSWRAVDGTLVFGELDGAQKYLDQRLTGRREAFEVMAAERRRESRVSAYAARLVRFTMRDVHDPERLRRLLDAFGVPRGEKPELVDGVPVPPADAWARPTIFGLGTMILAGERVRFSSEAA